MALYTLLKKTAPVLGIVLILLSCNIARAADISCPERPQGYVSDYANVLGDVSQLESQLENFEKQTSNEAYVVTVGTLDGAGIEEYALTLFNKWSIGKEREDNGVLLLTAIEDRQIRIEVGYGLESTLSGDLADKIISHEVAPAFSRGDYQQGITDGAQAIIQTLNGQYQAEEKSVNDHGKWIFLIVVLVVAVSIVLISMTSGRIRHRKVRGRRVRRFKK